MSKGCKCSSSLSSKSDEELGSALSEILNELANRDLSLNSSNSDECIDPGEIIGLVKQLDF